MTKPKIGFIGLGLMGGAMVGRLQDMGYDITLIANNNRTYVDRAIARGAREVETAKAVAQASDIIMLCMGTSDQVESRMRGDDGVMSGLSNGDIVIDFGTSLPASTRILGAQVAELGATYLDCPIGRTPMHAKDGLLNLMCSGDQGAFETVKPVLEDLGENVFHLGALGSGHTIKLINNFVAQSIANSCAEAFAISDITGVGRQQVFDVMNAGPLGCAMMEFIRAYAVDGDPQNLAFSIKNAAKDVGYYAQMTKDAGAQTRMANGALGALRDAIDKGMGEDLVPLMVDFFADEFEQ